MRRTSTLLSAVALSFILAAPGAGAVTVAKHDLGFWARVDLDTVVLYDWSMRRAYRAELRDSCPAMNAGKPARLGDTWSGRISGAFRDRMIFGYTNCYIESLERLSRDQLAALQQEGVQVAALSRR